MRGLGPLACLNAQCVRRLGTGTGRCRVRTPRLTPPRPAPPRSLADPGHVNIFTSSVGAEATVAVVALSLIPLALSAQRILKAKDDVEEFRPIPW